jgi:GT2 family glycosyltransferase
VFETVVVDNASDHSLKVQIENFNRYAKHKTSYINEPRLGLHHARHAGAHFLRTDILVFTDDDATFDSEWLDSYSKAFTEHADMAAAGGPVRPDWEQAPPKWLIKFMDKKPLFPILSLMEPYTEFRLDTDGCFFGVNMAIRREILFSVGGFDPELIGSRTLGNGESGLNRKLSERGYLIGYVPEAVVYHHIPRRRTKPEYIRQWAWHLGGSKMYSRLKRRNLTCLRLAAEAMRTLIIHWPFWLCSAFLKNRTDRLSLAFQLRSSAGWCQLNYLWWVYTDPQLREYLSQQDFIS